MKKTIAWRRAEKGSQEEHNRLVSEAILTLGKLPYCRVWRSETGAWYDYEADRWISYGLKGSADVTGILKTLPTGAGIRLEVECKSGKAIQLPRQVRFETMINKFGGLYILYRGDKKALVEAVNERGGY